MEHVTGWPVLGVWPRILRGGTEIYVELAREHGDVVSFSLAGQPTILLSDPALARDVLRRDVDDFRKGFGNEVLVPLIEHGVFLAEGDEWRNIRKTEAPFMTADAVKAFDPIVERQIDELCDEWSSLDRIDLYPAIAMRMLAAIGHAFLGTDVFERSAALRATLQELWRLTNRRMNPLRRAGEPLNLVRFRRALATLKHTVREAAGTAADGSILASLRATDLDEQAMLDDALTFAIAGQECTALATAWTLYFVACTPELVDHSVRDLVREAMRLRPPAWMMARQANQDAELGDFVVPRDTAVLMSPLVMHRHPDIWRAPDTFDPTRFADERFGQAQKRAFMPFGSGPRTCIGMHFALGAAERFVARILERFELSVPPNTKAPPGHAGLTLRPSRPLVVGSMLRE